LAAYHTQTAPLISYYEDNGALQRIDAMGEINVISIALSAAINKIIA
jgi:adenylate kinase